MVLPAKLILTILKVWLIQTNILLTKPNFRSDNPITFVSGAEVVVDALNIVDPIIQRTPPTSPPEEEDYFVKDAEKEKKGLKDDESKNDPCRCQTDTTTNTKRRRRTKITTPPARMAYLITAHNNRTISDATYLFRSIRSPGSPIILIHIDARIDWERDYISSSLHTEVTTCSCGARVRVESVYSPEWGQWSMNDPTFWGMETLVNDEYRGEWDVFVNLSGDTLAVYDQGVISDLFAPGEGPLSGYNFVTSSSCETGLIPTQIWHFPMGWHKREHYSQNRKGKFEGDPTISYAEYNLDGSKEEKKLTLTIHFGSQWMALQHDFVTYVVESLKRKDSLSSRFKKWLVDRKKLMTDETFLPTLIMHVYPFNETMPELDQDGRLLRLPSMKSIRYERMDEHTPSAFGAFTTKQRYDVPESSSASRPRAWGPYFLGTYDLHDIRESGALFVRKVSIAVDPNLVDLLPVQEREEIPNIRWPEEVLVSEPPDLELFEKFKERTKLMAQGHKF